MENTTSLQHLWADGLRIVVGWHRGTYFNRAFKKELITKEQYKIVSDFRKKDVPKFMAKYSFMGEDYLNDFVID